MHGRQSIKEGYTSYLLDYGDGYDRSTFLQYIACTLFDANEEHAAVEALRQAASNLESCRIPMRTQLPTRWQKIADGGLPPQDEEVLVWCKASDTTERCSTIAWLDDHGTWCFVEETLELLNERANDRVTHWMEIPGPPPDEE